MRVISKIGKAVLALAVAVSCLSLAPDAEARKQRLRLTTLAPKDSSFHKSLLRMGQEWKKDSKGQAELMVFAGGIQGGESAMVDRMRVNQIQAALISGVGLAEIDPAVAGLQQIPLLYRSLDELNYVMEKMAPILEERIREKGFVVLTWLDSGWVRIFSKDTLATPADMAKTKLFTWSGDEPQTNLLKKLGFRPVPIDSTEISSSLQTGLIDTVPMPPFFALAGQVYNTAPHMLDLNYVPLVGALVVTEKVWDRIDPEIQVKMKKAAEKAGREMTKSGRAENVDSVKIMQKDWGLQVLKSEGDALDAWQEVSNKAYPIIRDTTVPAEVFDKVLELLEEYRAENQ
ncbi:TRAP transporter substrate-binding protein DctP [Puniceicoccaceae bacterium K14]|nr:TRAP transporter substrate-binding protein DctP [Puniceicoccaceae bacterium K14]